jgi:hypothetical protein
MFLVCTYTDPGPVNRQTSPSPVFMLPLMKSVNPDRDSTDKDKEGHGLQRNLDKPLDNISELGLTPVSKTVSRI